MVMMSKREIDTGYSEALPTTAISSTCRRKKRRVPPLLPKICHNWPFGSKDMANVLIEFIPLQGWNTLLRLTPHLYELAGPLLLPFRFAKELLREGAITTVTSASPLLSLKHSLLTLPDDIERPRNVMRFVRLAVEWGRPDMIAACMLTDLVDQEAVCTDLFPLASSKRSALSVYNALIAPYRNCLRRKTVDWLFLHTTTIGGAMFDVNSRSLNLTLDGEIPSAYAAETWLSRKFSRADKHLEMARVMEKNVQAWPSPLVMTLHFWNSLVMQGKDTTSILALFEHQDFIMFVIRAVVWQRHSMRSVVDRFQWVSVFYRMITWARTLPLDRQIAIQGGIYIPGSMTHPDHPLLLHLKQAGANMLLTQGDSGYAFIASYLTMRLSPPI